MTMRASDPSPVLRRAPILQRDLYRRKGQNHELAILLLSRLLRTILAAREGDQSDFSRACAECYLRGFFFFFLFYGSSDRTLLLALVLSMFPLLLHGDAP